ncbi:peptidoglycan-binding protein [Kitasatospora sp. NPDC051170]|uniref:peptidoglycan-binding protein n=1 Tax=Kitasatospora sp. NPDC051170 TaxID=3364056 RepID=UPI0037956362
MPSAQADPGNPTVGYGYPNPGLQVQCVQYFVNQLTGLHILEDGRFGPQTEYGVKRIQQLASTSWAAAPLKADGYFGPATGQVVIERVKKYPWLVDNFQKATTCAHFVPSYTIVLN